MVWRWRRGSAARSGPDLGPSHKRSGAAHIPPVHRPDPTPVGEGARTCRWRPTPTSSITGNHGPRRRWVVPIAAFVLLVGGVFALNYPDMSNWVNQALQPAGAGRQQQTMATDPATVTAAGRAAGRARLQRPAQLRCADRGQRTHPPGAAEITRRRMPYESLLSHDPGGIMASINIPAITSSCPSTTAPRTRRCSRASGTSRARHCPWAAGTHAVLTAHRGLASAKLFTDLDRAGTTSSSSRARSWTTASSPRRSSNRPTPRPSGPTRRGPGHAGDVHAAGRELAPILVTGSGSSPRPRPPRTPGAERRPCRVPAVAVDGGAVVRTAHLRRADSHRVC